MNAVCWAVAKEQYQDVASWASGCIVLSPAGQVDA